MNHLKLLNPENVSEEEAGKYPVREAARAVVVDKDGLVALLHVSTQNYYKLPGGGIDEGEDKIAALRRECQEEIGCDVEVLGEIGIITEYRKFETLKQISYCYFAKVKGEKNEPSLTEEEIKDGCEHIWLSYEKVMHIMADSKANTLEGSAYIIPRDTIFLEAVKDLILQL